jgi:hypothetical protein
MEKLKKFEDFLNESLSMGRIPSNILEFAKRKGCVPDVKKIAK